MKKLITVILLLSSPALGQTGSGAGISQYIKNNKIQNVVEDTVTPANNVGLPVNIVSSASSFAVSQGTKGTIPQSWYVQPCDGTNCQSFLSTGEGKVSITQPLPAGSNLLGSIAQSGVWSVGRTWSLSSGADSVTASISGTPNVAVTSSVLPTGAATSAKQPALGTAGTASSDVITVQGIASMTALKVDGSAVTQPVSASSLPLPNGAATASNQTTANTSLSSIDGKLSSLGQKAMTSSAPVVIASDQSAIPASQSGTWNITNISGTVSLPTGAATAANQATANTSLSSIDTKTGKAPVNVNGSGSAASATVSTVITLTAPSNAVGFVLQNLDTSTANIRWSIGRTATTALGQQLQPGRDTGFVPCGANVSLVSETGTQNYDIQWVSQ